MEEGRCKRPRSLNSDVAAYVSFFNMSSRVVNLFWVDFKGELKRYGKIPPRSGLHINTYVTHPWMARDGITGFPMLFNGSNVFYPEPWNGEGRRTAIKIHIPVYPLYSRCLEAIHYFFKPEEVARSDIPVVLKNLLKTFVPVLHYTDYNNFQNLQYVPLQGQQMENGHVNGDNNDENGDVEEAEDISSDDNDGDDVENQNNVDENHLFNEENPGGDDVSSDSEERNGDESDVYVDV